MRTLALPLVAALLLAGPPTPRAATITLDTFVDALPPNPCLPLSGQAVLFTGDFCDGTSCPPDPLVTCETYVVEQAGLPGVVAGARRLTGIEGLKGNVRVDTSLQRLVASLGGPDEVLAYVMYGTHPDVAREDGPHLDLVAEGTSHVRLDLDGDFSIANPIWLELWFTSDTPGSAGLRFAVGAAKITSPGVHLIPLASFQSFDGFSWADVDFVELFFFNCENTTYPPVYECTHSEAPLTFSLGPIELVSTPTPARRASWGLLKAAYR
jgi:hypothetical protein